jgi:hypothetical protein
VQEAFDLRIPDQLQALHIEWKDDLLELPFFCDASTIAGIATLHIEKAFPYNKYRGQFVDLGRQAGFPKRIELYDVRRGSGRNLNRELQDRVVGVRMLRSSI